MEIPHLTGTLLLKKGADHHRRCKVGQSKVEQACIWGCGRPAQIGWDACLECERKEQDRQSDNIPGSRIEKKT
jgi:hypothetical protein